MQKDTLSPTSVINFELLTSPNELFVDRRSERVPSVQPSIQPSSVMPTSMHDEFDNSMVPAEYNSFQLDANLPLLVVEDNPVDLILITQQLDSLKINYVTANTGEACLELVDESMICNQPFRCILLDCYMPSLNGFQTAMILKARMKRNEIPTVPIIAFSAHDNREKAYKAGMSAWYTKPLREGDVKELMELSMKLWKLNHRRSKEKLLE
jgi:CheY-like chemotaxis protein